MKKKNLKPFIISGLVALGLGAGAVGTTFALFTDRADTKIDITAGKVDVSGTLDSLVLYSAEENATGNVLDENNAKYNLVEQNETFKNGGTAAFNEAKDTITLTNITPGDKAAFTFVLANESNVNIKYRIRYEAINEGAADSTAYLDLVKGLETTIGEEKFSGLKSYQTAWTPLAANEALSNIDFSIYLPMNKGNRYQNKTAKIKVSIEAVQGNAALSGSKEYVTVEEDMISPEVTATAADTVLTAKNESETVYVTTTIPAATTQVGVGQKVELVVSEMEMNKDVTESTTALNFDITLKVGGNEVSSFSKDIDVQIYVGPGLGIESLSHNGSVMDPSTYTYDATTGIITFKTKTFSPFTVVYYDLPSTPVRIGKNGYASLNAAVNAAKAGDVIIIQGSSIALTANVGEVNQESDTPLFVGGLKNKVRLDCDTAISFNGYSIFLQEGGMISLNGHSLTLNATTAHGDAIYNCQALIKDTTYISNSSSAIIKEDLVYTLSENEMNKSFYYDGSEWVSGAYITIGGGSAEGDPFADE